MTDEEIVQHVLTNEAANSITAEEITEGCDKKRTSYAAAVMKGMEMKARVFVRGKLDFK